MKHAAISPAAQYRVRLAGEDDFAGWRDGARGLAAAGVPPSAIDWQIGDAAPSLFASDAPPPAGPAFSVPRSFVTLAEKAILHSDAERFGLLYMLLLRLRERPGVMEDRVDPLLRRIEGMAAHVRRDMHKMRAFLRFREVDAGGAPHFVAWFEPDHHIVRANAGFFVRRFATMRWSILTSALSLHWDGDVLREGPGATKADAPDGDPLEQMWATYYASIFNPARVKINAMLKEMPRKYWKNMPETALVPGLIARAQARESGMIATAEAMIDGNGGTTWAGLRDEAAQCRRCPLWQPATQTVFGEGPLDARIMFVGEQPGDQEDIAGRPFVGPAGQEFDQALAAAGIDRARTYITNAVKHFKYEPRGKRRIHQKPDGGEISACRWWIDQERELIRPAVTVALGATAARSLLGKAVTIKEMRGRPIRLADGSILWVTIHPSFLLRMDGRGDVAAERAQFVDDLKAAAALAT